MKRRIHVDATKVGDVGRTSLCGYPAVETTHDIVAVTCRVCLARLRTGHDAHPLGDRRKAVSLGALASGISGAIVDALRACAGPPPVMTPQLWASSCRGAEGRRCGSCELCRWEREAGIWHAVEPWNKTHVAMVDEDRPRWPSVDAALVAFAEYERHGRHEPSACGAMLDRIRRGQSGGKHRPKRDSRMQMRADDIVHVRAALEVAYPWSGHARLGPNTCMMFLLARTAGVLDKRVEYNELAEMVLEDVGEIQALVRTGRKRVAEVLVAKGLVRG